VESVSSLEKYGSFTYFAQTNFILHRGHDNITLSYISSPFFYLSFSYFTFQCILLCVCFLTHFIEWFFSGGVWSLVPLGSAPYDLRFAPNSFTRITPLIRTCTVDSQWCSEQKFSYTVT